MKKFQNNARSSFFISVGIAILLHFFFVIILYLSKIENKPSHKKKIILLQLEEVIKTDTFEKILKQKDIAAEKTNKPSATPSPKIKPVEFANDSDTNKIFVKSDSTKYYTEFPDSAYVLDSFVVKNPNLIALKTALSQKLKNLKITESDSARIVKNFTEYLLANYRFLYPTPLSKFQEAPKGGGMISIPIDDIINLFK